MDTIKGQLKDAGYTSVELRDRPTTQWVPGADGIGTQVPAVAIDLEVFPAQGDGLVREGGRFVALDILDAAGITYDAGGVRVFNGALVVPTRSTMAKTPKKKA